MVVVAGGGVLAATGIGAVSVASAGRTRVVGGAVAIMVATTVIMRLVVQVGTCLGVGCLRC
jgi:hypothetical protein